MNRLLRRAARAALSIGTLLCLIIVLHALAGAGLDGPDERTFDAFTSWLDDPTIVVATGLRWIALGCCYYLLLVALAVTFLPSETLDGPLGRVVPARLIAMFVVLIGAAGVVSPMETAPGAPGAQGGDTDRPLTITRAEDPLTLGQLADRTETADHPVVQAEAIDQAQLASDLDGSWLVEGGDHLWSIAEETLQEHWGRSELTDSEIAGYWRSVIDANRDRLVEPGNPDLILPGQVLVLPVVPEDPEVDRGPDQSF